MSGVPPASSYPAAVCRAITERLDAYLSRELPEQTIRGIARHLETCPKCAAELETRSRIRAQLQAAVRDTPVPAILANKVRTALRTGPQPAPYRHPRTGLWAIAAAAVIILCVALIDQLRIASDPVTAILRKSSGRLAAVLNIGLRDHLQCAVFRKYSKEPESVSQMAARLGPDFDGLVPLVSARLPADFRIIQGHRCRAGARPYIHLIVSGGGKILSVILTRKQSGESLNGGVYQRGVDRFQIVGFESHAYLVYVISDLDPQQNLQLAANIAPALREYLASHPG